MAKKLFVLSLACLFMVATVGASKAVWLIRHCDKSSDDSDPCCTSKGYDRARGWAEYFKSRLTPSATGFVSSTYKSDQDTCKKTAGTPTNTYSACQHSQRMWLTASELVNQLGVSETSINTDYCTSDSMKDVAKLAEGQKEKEALIVWEHNQLVDIIKDLGVGKMSDWPDNLDDVYSLVFRVENGTMEYACYDYSNGSSECPSGVDDWLGKDFNKM